MNGVHVPSSGNSFSVFGDLLKYLRRRAHLTQLELSIEVGYSEAQISRLEQNQRLPDPTAVQALFIPALHLENETQLSTRLLELAHSARQEDTPTAGLPPYRGLLFFDEADAELFFGREALTAHLVGHVMALARDASTRFLTVVGASGSGKSSLVRAGLAVALKRVGWDVHLFTPTSVPLVTMASNLNWMNTPGSERALILVDQFEEVFTLCRDELERINFIERLISLSREPSGKYSVVIALRSDFYSHCAQYPLLRKAIAEEQEFIGQMTTEELRCAIEEPAKRGGWELEPGLVDILLQDVGAHRSYEPEPGALPLLSHALLATWQRRRGRTLTLQGYRASGGVRGAIAETAESVFTDQLNQTQQELARDVFLRLTELGEGTEDTRRRATLSELARQPAETVLLRGVLNTLAEARLITLNENSAEVAHEALIREWQRLHGWLTQDREGLLLHRHLTESAYEWETRRHDPSDLYRGARLAQAREWAADNEERLNDLERSFLANSIEQEEHDALEREALRQRELMVAQELLKVQSRVASQFRQRFFFLASAFTLAITLVVVVVFFWRQASQNALEARSREIASAAINNLADDPERSILLALQAIKTSHTVEAENALHRSIMESRLRLVLHHDGEVWSVAYSPDGRLIGTASQDKTARIWDSATGKLLLTLKGHTASVNGIAFSPDGKQVATCSDDHTAKVWDSTTGKLLLTFSGHTDRVYRITFSPDGKYLATTSEDQSAKIWDAFTGRELLTLTKDGEVFYDISYSQDGKRIVTSDENMETSKSILRVWDADTGKELLDLPIDGGYPRGVAFSPDGTRLAAIDAGISNGKVWDAATGKVLLNGLPDPKNGLLDITFSSDGKLAASGGYDQKARIWDVTNGRVLYTLIGHTNPIQGVAINPDRTRLATASWDHTVRVWDITPATEAFFIPGLPNGTHPMALSPDGSQILSLDPNANAVTIQDRISGKELYTLKISSSRGGPRISYSPDGKMFATISINGQDLIVDSKTGKQVATTSDSSSFPTSLNFSPNGTVIATGHEHGEINLVDVKSGRVIQTLQGPPPDSDLNNFGYSINSLTYSQDGSRLISGDDRGVVIVWDVKSGEKLMTTALKEDDLSYSSRTINWVDSSPSGKYVAVASQLKSASVFNASTGKVFLTLKGHTAGIPFIRFSPDGRLIATSSEDGTTGLWDATTGENILILPISGYISFLHDGKELAIGTGSGVYGFVLPINDLVALAKTRVTRTLTTDECQQYLHVAACPAQ
jgi:WD40 repeat protein/transcriptional regulator with XRE-family HTH domain